jgi:hypothetical protein
MDKLDTVLLALDELVDGGVILEIEPSAIVNRVGMRGMYVCVYVRMHACMYACVDELVDGGVILEIEPSAIVNCVGMRGTYACVCIYVRMYVCMSVSTCLCMYVCMFVCTC